MIRTYDEIIHPRFYGDRLPVDSFEINRSSAIDACYRLAPATTAGIWAGGTDPILEQLDTMRRNYGWDIRRYNADTFDALVSKWNWRAVIDEDQDCDEPVDYFHQESAPDPLEGEADAEEYVCLDLELLYGEVNGADDHE